MTPSIHCHLEVNGPSKCEGWAKWRISWKDGTETFYCAKCVKVKFRDMSSYILKIERVTFE